MLFTQAFNAFLINVAFNVLITEQVEISVQK